MMNVLQLLILLESNVMIVVKDVLTVHQQLVCNVWIILVFFRASVMQTVSRLGKGL